MSDWLDLLQQSVRQLSDIQNRLNGLTQDLWYLFGEDSPAVKTLDQTTSDVFQVKENVRVATGKVVDEFYKASEQSSLNMLRATLVACGIELEEEDEPDE